MKCPKCQQAELQENSEEYQSETTNKLAVCDFLLCRLYSQISFLFSSTKEDEEIYKFMYDSQKKTLEMEYKVWIGRLLILMALSGFVWSTALRCLNVSDKDEDFKLEVLMFNYGVVSVILFLILYYIPNSTGVVSTLIILFTLLTATLMTTIKEEYRLWEFFLPASNVVFIVLIIVPTQLKTNLLAYGFWMLCLPWSVKYSFGTVSNDCSLAVMFASCWFTMSNLLIYNRLKSLYMNILKCEKLIIEMKKILHIFPHGVIITNGGKTNLAEERCFTNREFDRHIWKIRNKLEELGKIEITLSDEKVNDELEKNKYSLHFLLQEHELKVKKTKGMIETDIEIEKRREFEDEKQSGSDVETSKQTFHVKSLNVEWEGSSSFMHVFIETTNIVKLEKAKNNIKCQKIMFASASHEFRTPLNAIMNSYQFIDNSFNIAIQTF